MRRSFCRLRDVESSFTHRRRGSLFHYYMMYLFLSGLLLSSAGLCIHSVLSADRIDAEQSAYLNTVMRLDESIRADVASAESLMLVGDVLTIPSDDGITRTWTIDRNILARKEQQGDDVASSDRFIFLRRTELTFQQAADSGSVILTIVEPPRIPSSDDTEQDTNTNRDGGTERQSIEIILPGRSEQKPAAADKSASRQTGGAV